jgi:Flp pilus assembly protein TadD
MKSKIFVLFAILVFCASLHPAMGQAWRGHGRVTGTVTDSSGAPIEGVTIKFSSSELASSTEVKSDKKGSFVMSGIRGGSWNVDFTKDGYQPVGISTSISEAGYNKPIKMTLEKGAAAPPAAAAPSGGSSSGSKEKQKGPDLSAAIAAQALMDQKDYKGAIAKFQEALTTNPNLYQIYGDIGVAYTQLGDYDNAIKSYETFIEKEKAAGATAPNPKPRIDLANIYLQKKDLEAAKKYLAQVDESQITDPSTFYNIGVSYYNSKDYDSAIKYFQKSVTVDPKFPDGYLQLGYSYMSKRDNAKAIESFKKVIEVAPNTDSAKEADEAIKGIQ